jgi:nitrogen-specific signal transduction histidine kinase
VLHAAPLDVLLFDTDLICRYAAPADGSLFGRTEEELLGRHAAEIFPDDANGIQPVLAQAAHAAARWENPAYRVRLHDGATERVYCWSVKVEPVVTDQYHGVLVTLADVQDLVDENERLESIVRAQQYAQRQLQTDVRTMLTPAIGYLQAIVRRPEVLHGRSPRQIIERNVLPHLRRVVDAVDGAVVREGTSRPTS